METSRLCADYWIKNDSVDVSTKRLYGKVEEHWHEFYEIELIISGAGDYNIDGIDYPIQSGSLFMMSPSSFHHIDFTSDTEIINLMFATDVCDADFLCRLFRSEPHVTMRLSSEDVCFAKMLAEDMVKNDHVPYMIAALNCLIGKFLLLHEPEPLPVKDAQMQRAILYMQNHFREGVSLAEAARIAHYSPNYFGNRFKEYFGTTFKEYIMELRFTLARKMLVHTALSVTDICFSCGFADFSNFMYYFKKRHGMTPKAFRAKNGMHM